MPAAISVAGRELRLNGMGVHKEKVFFKVYTAWLYLEDLTTDAQELVAAEETKRLVIVMLRDVSREQFVQAVEKGIRRNSGPVMPTLRARLDLLKQKLPVPGALSCVVCFGRQNTRSLLQGIAGPVRERN